MTKATIPDKKKSSKPIIIGVVVLIVIAIAVSGGTSKNEVESNRDTVTTASAEQTNTPNTEEIKSTADANDRAIAQTVWSAKEYNDNLTTQIQGVASGGASMFDIYSYAGETEDFMRTLLGRIDDIKVSGDTAEAYKNAADSYVSTVYVVASDIRDFIDTEEYSKLESVQQSLQMMPILEREFSTARTEYLTEAGFSDEEIAQRPAIS